jgi:hypothetical protein
MPGGGLALQFSNADAAYRMASLSFEEWLKACGRAPWIGHDPMRDFEDEEFPLWTMEAA